jgi:hypothetical protein
MKHVFDIWFIDYLYMIKIKKIQFKIEYQRLLLSASSLILFYYFNIKYHELNCSNKDFHFCFQS